MSMWALCQLFRSWLKHCILLFTAKEAVVLARWLKGICLSVAAAQPTNEHAQQLVHSSGIAGGSKFVSINFQSWSRLRAAIFVNLVAMRDAISKRNNDGPVLRGQNLKALQTASYLWHSAHNSFMFADLFAFFLWNKSLWFLCLTHPRFGVGSHIGRTVAMENSSETSQVLWLKQYSVWSSSLKAFCTVMTWPVLRLEHIVYECAGRLSPLPASTYADEDMVGKIKQFAIRSHPARLGYCILQRYAAYCCCRWLREMTEWVDFI